MRCLRVAGGRLHLLAAAILLAGALAIASLFRGIDHDEGQYVAAVALMRHGLPYRDFAYLQTPLQPLLFAPLNWVCAGWLFPALRVANALLATASVGMIALAARAAGAGRRGMIVAALALATSHMMLFAATVARNDTLPLLLYVTGLWLLLRLIRAGAPAHPRMALLAGLALGAAASAKLNYGLPAAAAGLFALIHWRAVGIRTVAAFALGGLLGGLPVLWLWSLAPEAAWFGIIDYGLKAPVEWRMLNGQAFMVQTPLSLLRMLRFLAQGCGLVALVAVAVAGLRAEWRLKWQWKWRGANRQSRLLALMIAAGLLAAWLPRPIYVQYLGPLLPALFLCFARLADRPFWRKGTGRILLALSMAAGVTQTLVDIGGNLVRGDSPVLAVTRDARRVGRIVRAADARGPVVTLSPERMIDSGIPFDPRFATGLFLFRTRAILTTEQARRFHALPAGEAGRGLDARPPAAILVGFESASTPAAPAGLDALLTGWARSRGYRPVRVSSATLYVRPR